MGSLFHRESEPKPEPTPYDRIGPEIAHLKKRKSTRHGQDRGSSPMPWLITLTILAVIWLYVMDVFYFSYYKYEGVHAYLYLHNYGGTTQADRLAASGILSPDEVATLNRKQGKFQDYAVSVDAAEKESEAIIAYLNGVKLMHAGKPESLDLLSKIRYTIFIRPGVPVPTKWDALNPSVND